MSSQTIYQSLPEHLSIEETASPSLVLTDFFHCFDLHDTKKYIRKWTAAAYTTQNWKKESPGIFLFFYEKLVKLLEATWLLNQMDHSLSKAILAAGKDTDPGSLINPGNYYRARNPMDGWNFFPRSLKWKEYLNPYKVLKMFFRVQSLAEWKGLLYELLDDTLSNNCHEFSTNVSDLINLKTYLDKITDACHLIVVRESA